jgi:hypothetical protein
VRSILHWAALGCPSARTPFFLTAPQRPAFRFSAFQIFSFFLRPPLSAIRPQPRSGPSTLTSSKLDFNKTTRKDFIHRSNDFFDRMPNSGP